MKIKLTNYDSSAYKQLEEKLNLLSKQGYNCKSVDFFTVFKKDNQHFYYLTDIFVPIKNSNKSNRQQRDEWLLNYVEHGYEFIGKCKKIYVFKTAKPIKVKSTSNELLLTYFKKNKTLSNIFLVFISLLISLILIPNILTNNSPDEFITNGAILLHYTSLLLCIALIIRFFNNYINTEKIKESLTKNKKASNNKSYYYLFSFSNWLLIITIISIIFGFTLDTNERKIKPINKNILSLEILGFQGNQHTYDSYNESSSLMINKAYNYLEANENNDMLMINYYEFSSSSKAKRNLENYLDVNIYQKKKEITNGYLLSNGDIYDNIIFIKNNKLIVVQTTFNLLENNLYQQIIDFKY